MNLINQMKLSMDAMTLGDKLTGSMIVTLLGIGIVFAALILLFFTIVAMEKIIVKPQSKEEVNTKPVNDVEEESEDALEDAEEIVEDTELVAVITAAIASSLNTSTHNIVVRNITRVEDTTPSWAKAGRINQITNN